MNASAKIMAITNASARNIEINDEVPPSAESLCCANAGVQIEDKNRA
jgi:hypothetical protein